MKGKELALKYLSLRSRSVFEMREYLFRKKQKEEDIELIIQELLELGYLDDLQYAKDYVQYARSKNRGLIRISKELYDKGISRETLEDALYYLLEEEIQNHEIPFSESERAKELVLDWVNNNEIDEKLLGKIARKLETLGYNGDTIYEAIGLLMLMRSENNGCN